MEHLDSQDLADDIRVSWFGDRSFRQEWRDYMQANARATGNRTVCELVTVMNRRLLRRNPTIKAIRQEMAG